jgi:hypothetical protein
MLQVFFGRNMNEDRLIKVHLLLHTVRFDLWLFLALCMLSSERKLCPKRAACPHSPPPERLTSSALHCRHSGWRC